MKLARLEEQARLIGKLEAVDDRIPVNTTGGVITCCVDRGSASNIC